MFDSVRVRLTLWHVGILALLLVTLSAGLYTVLRQNFYDRADATLKSVASATSSILGKELSESGLDELAARNAVKTLNFPDQTLAIFDANGDLLAERPFGSSDLTPMPRASSLRDGEASLYTVSWGTAGELHRVAAMRVTLDPVGRSYVIVTSRSLTPLLGELAADRKILAMAIPAGLLLAGLGGWYLARKSLEPVTAMADHARRIGAENLEQRLPVVNARDELGKLAATFNELLSRLSSSFSLQRQFMADASHQLRTPLSVIRLTSSVTLEKKLRSEEEYRGALATIDEQSRRLTRIVEDMFRLARADAGRLTLHQQRFYLDELLATTARAAAVLGASKGVAVEAGAMEESEVVGDEELLQQMMLNLLDNAVKYSSAGGKVRMELARRDGFYCITVQDAGAGIPEEEQAHIFDRFYQVNKTDAAGTGLGLPIARSIAEAHGGSLKLERSDASGTWFAVKLPAS